MERWHWGLASKRWGKFQSEGWQPVVEGGIPGWGSSVSRHVRVCSGSSQPSSVVGAGDTRKNDGWGCYLNVPICVTSVIRASSFPVLSRPRDFSDLPTSAVSVFKHNRDGTIFSTKDHIRITPSDFLLLLLLLLRVTPCENSEMTRCLRITAIGNHCSYETVISLRCAVVEQRLRTWSWV